MLGSQTSKMGEFEIRQRLIVVRRLLGNDSIGPSAVWVQSIGRISSPISPPPSQCLCVTFLSMRSSAKIQLVDRHGIGWAPAS